MGRNPLIGPPKLICRSLLENEHGVTPPCGKKREKKNSSAMSILDSFGRRTVESELSHNKKEKNP
jgi:hypothetical protein